MHGIAGVGIGWAVEGAIVVSKLRERRSIPRTRVQKGAKIVVGNQTSLFDCLTLDLTSLGACLQLFTTSGIPDKFDLTFDAARSLRPCCVAWRTERKLGVTFDKTDEDAGTA
jgi:hypothetical protein